MLCKVGLALVLLCATVQIVLSATDKVVCYWGTWSVYRWGNGRFTVDKIDPTLCTHIIYTFVGIESDGNVKLLDTYLDIDLKNFEKLNALKQQNSNLKTLVAIGGWNEGSVKYSSVAADPVKRANLIKSALALVQRWGFNGFDLDWEYPSQRGGAAADKANYVTLIKEFREEWDKHGLLLTAAVAAAASSVDLSYDVPRLSQYLDFIHVMTYDLHGAWDDVTGQNAPLYASSIDISDNQKLLNVDAAIRGWIERGANPQKLVLGLGVYGRTFTLANQNNNKLGAPIVSGGNPGRYTSETGMIGYNEIVELLNGGDWTVIWDDEQMVPYMVKGNQWIGFDNPKSIAIKVEYAKRLNLGGVMIWSIETDDFNGIGGTKYPILNAINKSLKGDIPDPEPEPNPEPVPTTLKPKPQPTTLEPKPKPTSLEPKPEPTTSKPKPEPTTLEPKPEPTTATSSSEKNPDSTPKPKTTTESTITTSPSDNNKLCTEAGYVRDPQDCSAFYYCMPYNGDFLYIKQQCDSGLVYDKVDKVCRWPSDGEQC